MRIGIRRRHPAGHFLSAGERSRHRVNLLLPAPLLGKARLQDTVGWARRPPISPFEDCTMVAKMARAAGLQSSLPSCAGAMYSGNSGRQRRAPDHDQAFLPVFGSRRSPAGSVGTKPKPGAQAASGNFLRHRHKLWFSRLTPIEKRRRSMHDGLLGGVGAGDLGGEPSLAEHDDPVRDGQQLGQLA